MNQQLMMLSREQLEALLRFISQEGRSWKKSLLRAWQTGRYPDHVVREGDDAAYLQKVRNTYGTNWLVSIKSSDMDNANKLIINKALEDRSNSDYACYLFLREHTDLLIGGLDLAMKANILDGSERNEIEDRLREIIMLRETSNNNVLRLASQRLFH